MDGKKPAVPFSCKRKHNSDTDTKSQASGTGHAQKTPAIIIIRPNILKPEENKMVYGPILKAIYERKGISVTVAPTTLYKNSSSKRGLVKLCQVPNNVQGMPSNNQSTINSNDNMAAASIEHGGNGGTSEEVENSNEENIDGLLEKLEDIIANRELTQWEDAVDAFRKAIELMLKKVQDIKHKLKAYKALDELK